MGITRIKIRNFKSLKNITFDFERDAYAMQCIVGKNGAGKSNFLDAIHYFYHLMLNENGKLEKIIDSSNFYLQFAEIEIEYDFTELFKRNLNPYYNEKMECLTPFIKENKMRVMMSQYKNNKIQWYPTNISKEVRKLLCKLFPIYYIDTRFISLRDWTNLWDIVTDISISKSKMDNEDMQLKMDDLLKETYGEKYVKAINEITKILEAEGIDIDTKNYKEKYKNALTVRLGGSNFLSEENTLSYYSDGVNSLKYIKLAYRLICSLSTTGWKNPLIIIDEPEIGLHSDFINELVKCFEQNINRGVNTIISTHSSHLVSELMKSELLVGIWRVDNENLYSYFEKLKSVIDINQKYLITDVETTCYFSKALLFVEGKSELQILKNRRLLELYSFMDKINILNYDSDNSMLKIVYPEERNVSIPSLTIVDMDKILFYSYEDRNFSVKKDSLVNPLYSKVTLQKQKYMFYETSSNQNQKALTYNKRLKINKMLSNGKYLQNEQVFFINNAFFEKVINEVKTYCLQYGVYPMRTTIEGALVNDMNVEKVIMWLSEKLSNEDFVRLNEVLDRRKKDNVKYRTTLIRLILNGKLDVLKNYTEKGVKIDNSIKNEIAYFRGKVGKKVDGWIGEFLEYYFLHYIDVLNDVEQKRKQFENDFAELEVVLQKSKDMLRLV